MKQPSRWAATVAVGGVVVVASCRQTPPVSPGRFVQTAYATGLPGHSTGLRFAPDGRLFVGDQAGAIQIVERGRVTRRPFLSLPVTWDPLGERGLVGFEFDPSFDTNQHVFVAYTTATTPPRQRISRFTAETPERADRASEKVLFESPPLQTRFHVSGSLAFGPDGKLYFGLGDNLGTRQSHDLSIPFGKLMRIDRDGGIPPDNPFYGRTTGSNRAIWAVGLRNVFTIAFDQSGEKMAINDTGQSAFEEINLGVAGGNYGWEACEGTCATPRADVKDPVFSYGHEIGPSGGCAIDGGIFYEPGQPTFPRRFLGRYLFIDFCSRWLKALDFESGEVETISQELPASNNNSSTLVALEVGRDGAVYFLSRFRKAVYRIQFDRSTAP